MLFFSQTLSSLHTYLVGQLYVWKSITGPTSFRQTVILGQTRNLADKAILSNDYETASFLAPSAPHNGDWLLALPITACGLVKMMRRFAMQSLSDWARLTVSSHMAMLSSD